MVFGSVNTNDTKDNVGLACDAFLDDAFQDECPFDEGNNEKQFSDGILISVLHVSDAGQNNNSRDKPSRALLQSLEMYYPKYWLEQQPVISQTRYQQKKASSSVNDVESTSTDDSTLSSHSVTYRRIKRNRCVHGALLFLVAALLFVIAIVRSNAQRGNREYALDRFPSDPPPDSAFPLGVCQGDCDFDSDCEDGLFCYHRPTAGSGSHNGVIPGCQGVDKNMAAQTDYCIPMQYIEDEMQLLFGQRLHVQMEKNSPVLIVNLYFKGDPADISWKLIKRDTKEELLVPFDAYPHDLTFVAEKAPVHTGGSYRFTIQDQSNSTDSGLTKYSISYGDVNVDHGVEWGSEDSIVISIPIEA